jgi:hypothetical protein
MFRVCALSDSGRTIIREREVGTLDEALAVKDDWSERGYAARIERIVRRVSEPIDPYAGAASTRNTSRYGRDIRS